MLKKIIYVAVISGISLITTIVKGPVSWIHFLNYLFLWNLPVAIISFFLFSIERGMWNFFRYSWKRFAIFFPDRKRRRLMEEFHASSYEEMEEKVRAKYLYRDYDFPINEVVFIPSIVIFISILVYIFIFY